MIIGIDLGTTNCAVAVWRNGAVEMIPNSLGHNLTPSAVSIGDKGEVIVGLPARERQTTHPGQTTTTFKRYMGSQRLAKIGQAGHKGFLPEELSALVLAKLKVDAEAYLDQPVTEAVITVPAYFNDKQRKATRRAGELAGLKVERLLNEPTAAALAYGIHQRDEQSRFLVFDLGGGTFDVSVLEIFEGVIEVRASTGDNRLGGEDFNELLVARMAKHFAKELPDPREDSALMQRLHAAAERARRALSLGAATTMTVVWQDKPYELELTSDWLEEAADPLIRRLREPVLRSLRDSGIRVSDLDEIVLVGGTTRMPVVRKAVTKMFGRFPAASINPDEAVAAGAAVQAGLKARDEALSEVVVTDVCPYTLGVDTSEIGIGNTIRSGLFAPIIERNTTIPASRVKIFSTLQDNQREVAFDIFQGESRLVSDNIKLGHITVPVPPKKAGQVSIECRLSYDINGLLEVDIHVPETGKSRQLVIVDSNDVPPAELEKRRAVLAALKVHPRDADSNQAALARALRCYEDYLGARDYVAGLISAFEAALDRQDPRGVEDARAALLAALDELEGPTFL